MDKTRFWTRFVAAPLAVAVAAGGSLLLAEAANAAPAAGSLGTLTFTPTSGLDTQIITAHTSGGCTTGGDSADLEVTGPVGAGTPTFPTRTVITSTQQNNFSATSGFGVPLGLSLKDSADILHKTIQPGEYDITVVCQDSFTAAESGTFTGAIFFTDATHYDTGTSSVSPSPTPSSSVSPSPTPSSSVSPSPTPSSSVTPTPVPGATATTTTLHVIRIPLPFGLGSFVLPFANVAPGNAAGTIQFKDGTTNLGAPVPVSTGFVFGGFFVLPAHSHSLTAEFTPADPAAFKPSTSNTVKFRF